MNYIKRLEKSSASRVISVSGKRIQTELERIPPKEGYGYHMKIEYLDS